MTTVGRCFFDFERFNLSFALPAITSASYSLKLFYLRGDVTDSNDSARPKSFSNGITS